jgi:hypothetical protein
VFLVESIKGCKERAGPLNLVSQWTHISLEDCVYQPQSRRQLCLTCAIPLPILLSAITHILHNHVQIKNRRLSVPWRWVLMWAAKCLRYVFYGDLELIPINFEKQHSKLVRIKFQILVECTDKPGMVEVIHRLEERHETSLLELPPCPLNIFIFPKLPNNVKVCPGV